MYEIELYQKTYGPRRGWRWELIRRYYGNDHSEIYAADSDASYECPGCGRTLKHNQIRAGHDCSGGAGVPRVTRVRMPNGYRREYA